MRKEIIFGIYMITSPSGYIYIGQSKDIYERWEWYKKLICENQPRLYRSLLKHGIENHKFEIVEECSIEQLNEKEIYYIKFFNCFNTPHGLNLTPGGDGCAEWSDESKQKIGDANSKRIVTQHQKDAVASKNKKIWENLSQEEKDKRLFGIKNYVKTEETKKNQIEGIREWHANNKKNPITEETRKKHSDASKKMWVEKRHTFKSRKGEKRTAFPKKSYSDAAKKRYLDHPEKYQYTDQRRKETSERHKGKGNPMYNHHYTDEERKNMSDSQKLAHERIRQEKLTMIF